MTTAAPAATANNRPRNQHADAALVRQRVDRSPVRHQQCHRKAGVDHVDGEHAHQPIRQTRWRPQILRDAMPGVHVPADDEHRGEDCGGEPGRGQHAARKHREERKQQRPDGDARREWDPQERRKNRRQGMPEGDQAHRERE